MKVTVRRAEVRTPITITTEYIKLESFLKLANAVDSGGVAKLLIQDGEAKVNGEVCTMRGKKLRDGDKVDFGGVKYLVCHAAE